MISGSVTAMHKLQIRKAQVAYLRLQRPYKQCEPTVMVQGKYLVVNKMYFSVNGYSSDTVSFEEWGKPFCR